ncbi:MAG: hypothetical protein HYV04_04470 [Deltaproteobacteria bacterium]|nr:hypothetical protein [Deltaproteobacteria bacterium]
MRRLPATLLDLAVQSKDEPGPRVRIEQAAAELSLSPGIWRVAWRIENLGDKSIRILAGRLPHSQFRSEEREFIPNPEISEKECARLDFSVSCREPPRAVVENAFLILRVLYAAERWRVLARLRVCFNEDGQPWTLIESVTAHRIGFSGV